MIFLFCLFINVIFFYWVTNMSFSQLTLNLTDLTLLTEMVDFPASSPSSYSLQGSVTVQFLSIRFQIRKILFQVILLNRYHFISNWVEWINEILNFFCNFRRTFSFIFATSFHFLRHWSYNYVFNMFLSFQILFMFYPHPDMLFYFILSPHSSLNFWLLRVVVFFALFLLVLRLSSIIHF